ncbi:hypothetical protein NQ318_005734 [Aromia moschata]|uniref:GATA-type domain-containing protein n=1 Tax=Aromia moschata TaxID=1265417 RepID=A0AAV8YTE1_9CUCU|nr:hypothetical protein NQ318_005734 [Aromia moschata]
MEDYLKRRNAPTEAENNRPSPQPGKEPGETSSVTEDDNDSEDDSDSREAQYRCSHCFATNSKDWQPGGKDRQLLCWDCRAHFKKTNELPPLNTPTAVAIILPTESPDASPQRMRTRNKAAKEQTTNRARPKRGGTETPEPKTPIKQASNGAEKTAPTPPARRRAANRRNPETPGKNRKRQQESKAEDNENEEKDLGVLKKKRERAESPSSVTTDSETVNEDGENAEIENEHMEMVMPVSSTPVMPTPASAVTTTPTSIISTNNNVIPPQDTLTKQPPITETIEPLEPKPATQAPAAINAPVVPVITSAKLQPPPSVEPMPLNVSIRLPDDINERKNLIKRNLETALDMKDMKYSQEPAEFNPSP